MTQSIRYTLKMRMFSPKSQNVAGEEDQDDPEQDGRRLLGLPPIGLRGLPQFESPAISRAAPIGQLRVALKLPRHDRQPVRRSEGILPKMARRRRARRADRPLQGFRRPVRVAERAPRLRTEPRPVLCPQVLSRGPEGLAAEAVLGIRQPFPRSRGGFGLGRGDVVTLNGAVLPVGLGWR